jgi:uncharacterized protein (TIGR04255 family)
MKLNNPPVTQTWIGFTFEQAPVKRPWDLRAADEFLSRFESALPHREAIFATQYEIQYISPTRRPKIVDREDQLQQVKARNPEGTHWLQVAEDRMVLNRTRGSEGYLGFESLLEEALGKLSEYVEFFQPSGLRSAELHYVDQIEIPIPPGGKLDLQKYFRLRVEIPDAYGPTWYFSTRLFLYPPIEGDILEVRFQSEPPDPAAQAYRFRIDWHMVCSGVATFDHEVVKRRLVQAHDCLADYFKASVTERTWALFEPSEEG